MNRTLTTIGLITCSLWTLFAGPVSAATVYPNPWVASNQQGKPVRIVDLAPNASVDLFTVSAQWIKTISANTDGKAAWDVTDQSGHRVASGIYVYTAVDSSGRRITGQIAIVK